MHLAGSGGPLASSFGNEPSSDETGNTSPSMVRPAAGAASCDPMDKNSGGGGCGLRPEKGGVGGTG